MCGALSFLVERPLGKQWTLALARHQNGAMRPRGSRPDALQSVTVLEALEGLAGRHGEAGVPFKDLEATPRYRLNLPCPDRCAECAGQRGRGATSDGQASPPRNYRDRTQA